MFHELRIYDLKAGAIPAYVDLFRFRGIQHVTRHLPLLGYWATDTGALNRLYHLWAYESLAERDARRAALAADAGWMQGFVPEGFPLILRQQNLILKVDQGSAPLDDAVAARLTPRSPQTASEAAFAPGRTALVEAPAAGDAGRIAPAAGDAARIAMWRVVSGDGPGRALLLFVHGEGDPFASASGAARHEVLRPLSCSPLR